MSDAFLGIWLFITSQVGLVAIGVLGGHWWGAKLRAEIGNLIDSISNDNDDEA